jgi:hypothetical protein
MKPHPRACWCKQCRPEKIAAFKAEYAVKVKWMTVPKPIQSPDALVPVRAHFRRHPGYLKKMKDLIPWAEGLRNDKLKEIDDENGG